MTQTGGKAREVLEIFSLFPFTQGYCIFNFDVDWFFSFFFWLLLFLCPLKASQGHAGTLGQFRWLVQLFYQCSWSNKLRETQAMLWNQSLAANWWPRLKMARHKTIHRSRLMWKHGRNCSRAGWRNLRGLKMANKHLLWALKESANHKLPIELSNSIDETGTAITWCDKLEVLMSCNWIWVELNVGRAEP